MSACPSWLRGLLDRPAFVTPVAVILTILAQTWLLPILVHRMHELRMLIAVVNDVYITPASGYFYIGLAVSTVVLFGSAVYAWLDYLYERGRLRQVDLGINVCPESAKPDSPYFVAAIPKCQFAVWLDNQLLGHGWRYKGERKDYFVCPTHVLSERTLSTIRVQERRDGKIVTLSETPVSAVEWKEVGPDLSVGKAIPLAGLKGAKVVPYAGKPLAVISTSHANQPASIGHCTHDAFGYLEYHGSTRPGFSGAVYCVGGSVVGMHMGGGLQNLGFATSYIVNSLENNEDSEEAVLRRMLRNARDADWEYATTGDPDEMQIRLYGKYYRVSKEVFSQLMAELEPDDDGYISPTEGGPRGRRAKRRRGPGNMNAYYDAECRPLTADSACQTEGNWVGPTMSRATSLSTEPNPTARLVNGKQILNESCPLEARIIPGRRETRKPSTKVSANTSTSCARRDSEPDVHASIAALSLELRRLTARFERITSSKRRRARRSSSGSSDSSTTREVLDSDSSVGSQLSETPLAGTGSSVPTMAKSTSCGNASGAVSKSSRRAPEVSATSKSSSKTSRRRVRKSKPGVTA
uniref:Serine protease n=1 Tax=Nufsystermes virus TaxID=2796621 RepID=A0A894KQQ6_9VIRU|nr:hypothetical protein [Nufsystermes virus]